MVLLGAGENGSGIVSTNESSNAYGWVIRIPAYIFFHPGTKCRKVSWRSDYRLHRCHGEDFDRDVDVIDYLGGAMRLACCIRQMRYQNSTCQLFVRCLFTSCVDLVVHEW